MRVNNYQFWQDWRDKTKITEKQIDNVFLRLYEGEKPTALLRELLINRAYNCPFVEHFPPLFCNSLCRLCGFYLYAYRSDRLHYRNTKMPYNILTAHCLKCGHQENMNCECLDCYLRESENKSILEHNQKIINDLESESALEYKNSIIKTTHCTPHKNYFQNELSSTLLKHRNVVSISKQFLAD